MYYFCYWIDQFSEQVFLSSCMLYFIYDFLFNNSDDLTDCKICMRKA